MVSTCCLKQSVSKNRDKVGTTAREKEDLYKVRMLSSQMTEVMIFFVLSSFRWRLKTDFVSGWTCNKHVDSNSSSRRRSDRQREKKRMSLEERYLLNPS